MEKKKDIPIFRKTNYQQNSITIICRKQKENNSYFLEFLAVEIWNCCCWGGLKNNYLSWADCGNEVIMPHIQLTLDLIFEKASCNGR